MTAPEKGASQSTVTEHSRISLAPGVLDGKAVIRGARLAVEFVIGLLTDGWSEAAILRNYPGVSHDDIIACLAYAREHLARIADWRNVVRPSSTIKAAAYAFG
jgi:uncharacterized protein (DUF433 family)